MAKSIVVDQIEVTQSGIVQIRFKKFSSDGDVIGYHRTAVEVNADVDAQVSAVNSHLGQEGFSSISEEDTQKINTICQAAWGM